MVIYLSIPLLLLRYENNPKEKNPRDSKIMNKKINEERQKRENTRERGGKNHGIFKPNN